MSRPVSAGVIGPRFITPLLALLLGAAVSVSGALTLIGVLAILGLTACLLFPLQVGLGLALISYLYNIGAVDLFGVVDIRLLEVGWIAVGAGLLLRFLRSRHLPSSAVPSRVIVVACVFLSWELASALVAGGLKPIVEVVQSVYLLAVGLLTARLTVASDTQALTRGIRAGGMVFLVASAVGLLGYVVPSLALPYYVVTLPGLSLTNVLPPSHGVVTSYGLARYSLINLGPVGTAAVAVAVLMIALGWLFDDRFSGSRAIARVVTVVAAASLLLTLSRAGWLVGLAGALYMVIRSGHRRAVPGIVALILCVVAVFSVPAVSSRLADIDNPYEGSNRSHERLYATALYMANHSPVVGWGPGRFSEVAETLAVRGDLDANIKTSDAHNFIMQAAAETGWPGAALALLLVSTAILAGFRGLWRAPLRWHGLLIAALALLSMGLTMNIFRTEVLWSAIGVVIGVARVLEREGSGPEASVVELLPAAGGSR